MNGFAAIVPVGPEEVEVARLRDLVDSLMFYGDDLKWLVFIDDVAVSRSLPDCIEPRNNCTIVSLPNPRNGLGLGKFGGMATGILAGLNWLAENAAPDFVLKLDTDSLVIGLFSTFIREQLKEFPSTGILGQIGAKWKRSRQTYEFDFFYKSPLIEASKQVRRLPKKSYIASDLNHPPCRLVGFNQIRHHIEMARGNGYTSLLYCQGGGYVISYEMLRRMVDHGFLTTATAWANLPFHEDVILGMYAHAVGLKLLDRSGEREPFGHNIYETDVPMKDWNRRLGCSIIHPVKPPWFPAEQEVRSFFRSLRII